jgi:hypothetical protein
MNDSEHSSSNRRRRLLERRLRPKILSDGYPTEMRRKIQIAAQLCIFSGPTPTQLTIGDLAPDMDEPVNREIIFFLLTSFRSIPGAL